MKIHIVLECDFDDKLSAKSPLMKFLKQFTVKNCTCQSVKKVKPEEKPVPVVEIKDGVLSFD